MSVATLDRVVCSWEHSKGLSEILYVTNPSVFRVPALYEPYYTCNLIL